MKLADLEFAPSLDLPAPTSLFRIQRTRARPGSLRIGRILLPPPHLLSGRFDIPGVSVGYFAEAPETAVYESLCRREATAVSIQAAAMRSLLCVQTAEPLKLLDLRTHANRWPVLQSLRLDHTQQLAAEAQAAGFRGIVYRSVQQHGKQCFAIFGEALAKLPMAWSERLIESGTGNLHWVLACAINGARVMVTP